MVRTTKSDKQTAAPAPAVVAPVADVAVEKTAAKKTKAPKVAAPAAAVAAPVAVPVEAPVVHAAPATDAVATTSKGLDLTSNLSQFSAKLQQLTVLFSAVKSDFKTLEKNVSREMKNAQKSSSRKKKSGGNREPSGFVKPTRISDELANFLGKSIGTEMARTQVSREINAYIKTNGLQDKLNGRTIHADTKLSTLLNLKKEDSLTYFNLQKYMKHHFIKADATAAAPAV